MSKFVRKLMPFLSCDIPAIENWLCDMAKKGLLFVDSGVFTVRFEKAEPINRRFHLEYADGLGSNIKEEKREVYEECGWTVVSDFKPSLVVVYTDDEFAPEPYDDQAKMAEPYEKIYKNQRALAFVFIVMAALMKIGYPLQSLLNGDNVLLSDFLEIGTGRYIIRCIVFVLLICECIFRFARAKRLKEYLESVKTDGEQNSETVKKNAFGTAMIVLAAPLVIAFCIQLFTNDFVNTYYPSDFISDETAENYPFPTLEEINADEYVVIKEAKKNGAAYEDYIYEEKDLFAPRMIELWQDSWDDICRYTLDYYEMRSDKLAEKLLSEKISEFTEVSSTDAAGMIGMYSAIAKERGKDEAKQYLANAVTDYNVSIDKHGDADVVYIIDDAQYDSLRDNEQILMIRKGNELVYVYYRGDSDLSEYVDLYISYLKK